MPRCGQARPPACLRPAARLTAGPASPPPAADMDYHSFELDIYNELVKL